MIERRVRVFPTRTVLSSRFINTRLYSRAGLFGLTKSLQLFLLQYRYSRISFQTLVEIFVILRHRSTLRRRVTRLNILRIRNELAERKAVCTI